MLEMLKVDEEVLSIDEGYPLEVSKDFSGLREKYCDESLSNEVRISFKFSLIFLEEVSMISLRK